MIDSHIHLDQYDATERQLLLQQRSIQFWIAVSTSFESAQRTYDLAQLHERIIPCFGSHPELPLPDEKTHAQFIDWMIAHAAQMKGIGEVGLPYYSERTAPLEAYVERLESFIHLAARYDIPLNLHVVHEHVPLVLSLVERANVQRVHFHWYKSDPLSTERLIANGYTISITPDIVYKARTRELAKRVPLSQLMIESDGPYPLEGPFQFVQNDSTLMTETVRHLSTLKRLPIDDIVRATSDTAKRLYRI